MEGDAHALLEGMLIAAWAVEHHAALATRDAAHFRRVLRQNPELPQGLTETDGGAKWFTLDEVLRLERLQRPGKRPVTATEFAAQFDLAGRQL